MEILGAKLLKCAFLEILAPCFFLSIWRQEKIILRFPDLYFKVKKETMTLGIYNKHKYFFDQPTDVW